MISFFMTDIPENKIKIFMIFKNEPQFCKSLPLLIKADLENIKEKDENNKILLTQYFREIRLI